MVNIPYDPILHDLSLSPREMSAAEIVEYWLGNRKTFSFLSIFNLFINLRYVQHPRCGRLECSLSHSRYS